MGNARILCSVTWYRDDVWKDAFRRKYGISVRRTTWEACSVTWMCVPTERSYYNKGKPRKTCPVAGSSGSIRTSSQESGFQMCELYRRSLFVQVLCI